MMAENGTYLVGTVDTSLFHQTWGRYEVTLYYPAIASGVSQPPNGIGKPYPAVVFAHGILCTKEDYGWIGIYCAAHGYVAILFTTPSRLNPFTAFPQSAEGFSLCIDQLATLKQQVGGLLEGIIDEERIGIMGHSMGAIAALKAAAEDPRIRVAVSLAPGYFSFTSFTEPYLEACRSINIPTQMIMGSKDFICPSSDARTYYDMLPSIKEMLVIAGAFHDLGIWNAGNQPNWLGYIPFYDAAKQRRCGNITGRYFISWLNYFLRDDYSYFTYIFGEQAWRDLETGILSSLEFTREKIH